jgi:hypothetical protein
LRPEKPKNCQLNGGTLELYSTKQPSGHAPPLSDHARPDGQPPSGSQWRLVRIAQPNVDDIFVLLLSASMTSVSYQ